MAYRPYAVCSLLLSCPHLLLLPLCTHATNLHAVPKHVSPTPASGPLWCMLRSRTCTIRSLAPQASAQRHLLRTAFPDHCVQGQSRRTCLTVLPSPPTSNALSSPARLDAFRLWTVYPASRLTLSRAAGTFALLLAGAQPLEQAHGKACAYFLIHIE